MPRTRPNYSVADKMVILREHLIEWVPISEVCDKHGLQPTLFYGLQKALFEEGTMVFEGGKGWPKRQEEAQARKQSDLTLYSSEFT